MRHERLPRRGHTHLSGPLGLLAAIFHLHGHSHDEPDFGGDPALATTEGIRTVWLALAALGTTALIQIVIVAMSGSVALLADMVHNIGDTLNSIPLLVAFSLARRAATRRYTYGYGKAEDLAGVSIVLSIAISAAIALWESFQKFIHPRPMTHIPWVIAAAFIGFVGNEAVALLQIRTGRQMGSEAMVADGLHARIDGITSLAVIAAAVGTLLGFPMVDPIIGLLIGVSIVFITRDAAVRIWYRLMDAIDPTITERIEQYAGDVPGVRTVQSVRVRWFGHQLHADVTLVLDEEQSFAASADVTMAVRQALLTHIRRLAALTIETLPPVESERTTQRAASILPPRYQDPGVTVSAAPMGAATLAYDKDGQVAWDAMWTGYCELALAGGPPHRGSLLEPVSADEIARKPEQYERVVQEMERGIHLVTGLPTRRSDTPGWIGLVCESEEMALWLLRAIVVENVTVRREENVLWFPAGPDFRLEREIKNVVTVIAKTNHYWQEHMRTPAR